MCTWLTPLQHHTPAAPPIEQIPTLSLIWLNPAKPHRDFLLTQTSLHSSFVLVADTRHPPHPHKGPPMPQGAHHAQSGRTSPPHAKRTLVRAHRPAPPARKSTAGSLSPKSGRESKQAEKSDEGKPEMAASFLQYWFVSNASWAQPVWIGADRPFQARPARSKSKCPTIGFCTVPRGTYKYIPLYRTHVTPVTNTNPPPAGAAAEIRPSPFYP